jgi:hypothetical protein
MSSKDKHFAKCVVDEKLAPVYPGEVCSLSVAKKYGILDVNEYYTEDYDDVKTFNTEKDENEGRDKELCVQRTDQESAYAYCAAEHGIGFVRKAGEPNKCITVSCPTGFENEKGTCKKPLEDYAVSKRSRCYERWYDWFMIPNYHLGNRVYKATKGECYDACPPYHVPSYAKDPVITTSANAGKIAYQTKEDSEGNELNKCISRDIYQSGKYANGSDYSALAWIYRMSMTPSVVKEKILSELQTIKEKHGDMVNDAYQKLMNTADAKAREIAKQASSIRENITEPTPLMMEAHRKIYTPERLNYAYDVCKQIQEDETVYLRKFQSEMEDSEAVAYKKINMIKQACNALFCNDKESAINVIGKNPLCFENIKKVKMKDEEEEEKKPPSATVGGVFVQKSIRNGIQLLILGLIAIFVYLFITRFVWPKLVVLYYFIKKFFTGFGKSKTQMKAESIAMDAVDKG